MAASVKLVLRKDKVKSDGTVPVWIRITINRKSKYISTGIYVLPVQWNETKQSIRKSHPLAPTLNQQLQKILLEARSEALDAPSASAVKSAMSGVEGSLTAYFERFIANLSAGEQYWERKK